MFHIKIFALKLTEQRKLFNIFDLKMASLLKGCYYYQAQN